MQTNASTTDASAPVPSTNGSETAAPEQPESKTPKTPRGRVFGTFVYRLTVVVLLAYIATVLNEGINVYVRNSSKWSAIPVSVETFEPAVRVSNSWNSPIDVKVTNTPNVFVENNALNQSPIPVRVER